MRAPSSALPIRRPGGSVALWSAFAAAALSAALASLGYFTLETWAEDGLREAGDTIAAALDESSDLSALPRLHPDLRTLALRSPQGETRASRSWSASEATSAGTFRTGNKMANSTLWLELEFSRARLAARLTRFAWAAALIGAAATLLSGLFGAGLARRTDRSDLARSLHRAAQRLAQYTHDLEHAVRARTDELEAKNRELTELAVTDGLTGIKNHRFFRRALDFEVRRGRRRTHPLTLLMVDIDYFKRFNDQHGHPAGDRVLKEAASIFERNLRTTDVVARYGGEEFAIILLDTGPAEGKKTAEKLLRLIREHHFEGEDRQPNGKLSVSIGLASFPNDGEDPEQLIMNADRALYEAKFRGRDRLEIFAEDLPSIEAHHTDLQAVERRAD